MRKLIYIFLFFTSLSFGQVIDQYNYFASCTPDPNEQHTQANAASDPNCNEADTTTGWSAPVEGTLTSDEAEPFEGTSALKIVTGGGAVSFMRYDFAATAGDTFTVTLRAKSTQGSLARLSAWINCTGGPTSVVVTGSWVEYTYNITATATGNVGIRAYASSSSAGVAGDNIFIDVVSVVETT